MKPNSLSFRVFGMVSAEREERLSPRDTVIELAIVIGAVIAASNTVNSEQDALEYADYVHRALRVTAVDAYRTAIATQH